MKHTSKSNKSMARVVLTRAMRTCLAVFALAGLGNLAVADEGPTEAVKEPAELITKDIKDTGLISLGSALSSVSEEDLNDQRAKEKLEIENIFINEQNLDGSVSGNSAINTINGDNTISGDSFGSASGFVNSIQNTGNNVLIQSATIVNVSIED